MKTQEGVDFRYFLENWYVGPFFGKIKAKNDVLEKTKKIKFSNLLLNLILNFDFSIEKILKFDFKWIAKDNFFSMKIESF